MKQTISAERKHVKGLANLSEEKGRIVSVRKPMIIRQPKCEQAYDQLQ